MNIILIRQVDNLVLVNSVNTTWPIRVFYGILRTCPVTNLAIAGVFCYLKMFAHLILFPRFVITI